MNNKVRAMNVVAGAEAPVAGHVLRLIPLGAGHPPSPKGYGVTGSRAPGEGLGDQGPLRSVKLRKASLRSRSFGRK
jgi:hypothetical protein